MYSSLELIILLLFCSVGLVALLRNAKLPPMIAYFLVGLILGPSGLAVLTDSESNRHLVEFGIVFLMFTIGLEFSLPTLNSMRKIWSRFNSSWNHAFDINDAINVYWIEPH
jgi:CPA2 family monovalent cation:H+ antiporter-2